MQLSFMVAPFPDALRTNIEKDRDLLRPPIRKLFDENRGRLSVKCVLLAVMGNWKAPTCHSDQRGLRRCLTQTGILRHSAEGSTATSKLDIDTFYHPAGGETNSSDVQALILGERQTTPFVTRPQRVLN